jgi:hypothetical protein
MQEWRPSLELPEAGGWRAAYAGRAHPTVITEAPNLAATRVDLARLATVPMRTLPLTISHVQAEACVLACRALATPPYGFCLGDGTGVGKCRTLAAIAMERSSIPSSYIVWVTTSATLCNDVCTEARHVFGRPAARIWGKAEEEGTAIVAVTYRTASTPTVSAYIVEQLVRAGVGATIIFDEAHTGRNAQSAVGKMVREWQDEARDAGVVYSTATAASCATRMTYMSRIGLWGMEGIFRSDNHFIKAVGTSAASLELVGMHMKRSGRYLARELGVRAEAVEEIRCATSDGEKALYGRLGAFCDEANAAVTRKLSLFGRLLLSFKVRHACARARAHVQGGRRVLISLVLTGEHAARGSADGTAMHSVLAAIAENGHVTDAGRAAFIEEHRALAGLLPPDPLTTLKRELSDLGVSVLTGTAGGRFVTDVERFQDGTHAVAILSGAATSGICLHDVGAPAPAQRVHMMLQVPWSPEGFAQQSGRSCRAGQVTLPRYELLVTDIPSEARWTHSLSHRLRSMGAITRGDESAEFVAGAVLGSGGEGGFSRTLVGRVMIARCVRAACRAHLGDDQYAALCIAAAADPVRLPPYQVQDSLALVCLQGFDFTRYNSLHLMRAVVTLERGQITAHVPGPGACSIVESSWSPSVHRLFSPSLRAEIKTFLLVTARHRVPLPTDVTRTICEKLVEAEAEPHGTDRDAQAAVRSLISRRQYITSGNEDANDLYNATLSMSVQEQANIHKMIAQARYIRDTRGERSERTMNLRQYVLNDSTKGMHLRARLDEESDTDGVHSLHVSVSFREVDDPLPDWQRTDSLLAVGTSWQGGAFAVVRAPESARATHMAQLWYPGRQTHTQAGASRDDVLRRWQSMATFVGDAPTEEWWRLWVCQRRAFVRAKESEARALGRVYHVSTWDALRNWEVSRKRVLRCTPPEVERSFTCLLIR